MLDFALFVSLVSFASFETSTEMEILCHVHFVGDLKTILFYWHKNYIQAKRMAVFWVVAPCSLVEVYQKTAIFVLIAVRTSNPTISRPSVCSTDETKCHDMRTQKKRV
jgi:hypothetical protein